MRNRGKEQGSERGGRGEEVEGMEGKRGKREVVRDREAERRKREEREV